MSIFHSISRGGRPLKQKRTEVKGYLAYMLLVADHLGEESKGTANANTIKKLKKDLEDIYCAF